MAEQAPPCRPDIAASKLRAPTRTCYFNSFFLFKTEVALDGRPAEIGCSQDGELSLSCRREHDGEGKKACVSFPSTSPKVESILKKNGVFEVVTFFCDDSPLFQVTFSSEDELKRFLRRRERVEKGLADLFSHMLQPTTGQAQVPASPIPAQVSSTIFLMTPDWYGSQCGSIEVSLENYSDCVSVWKDSKVFEYGTVLSQKMNPKISIVKQSLTTSTSDLRQCQDTVTSTSDLRQCQDTATSTSDLRQGQDTVTSTSDLRQCQDTATSTSDLRQCQDKITSTSDLTELITENGNSSDPKAEAQSVSDSRQEQDDDDEISVVSVLRWLEEVSEWFVLGTHLRLPQHELKMIQQDHPSNSKECRLAMVDTWIRLGNASWFGLVGALWEIGRRRLAKKMAAKFGTPLPAGTSDQKEPSVQCELLTDISLKDQSLEDTTAALVLAEDKRNKALEEIAEHTRQLNQHIARLPQLGLEKEQLSTQLRETREGHQKLEDLFGKQTHALHTLEQEAMRLHSQLEQKDREIAAIVAEAEELKAKLQETTDQLTTASNEISKLKTEQELLKFKLESKRRELEKEQSNYEATVKELKAELATLRAEATSKAEQTGNLQGRLSVKTEEVENLKKALHKAEQGKPVLPEQPSPAAILQAMETTQLRVELATAEEGRQEVERQLGALQRQVQLLQDEITVLIHTADAPCHGIQFSISDEHPKYGMRTPIRRYKINPTKPNFGLMKESSATMFKPTMGKTKALFEEAPDDCKVKVAPQPFTAGAEHLTFHAMINGKPAVLKQMKREVDPEVMKEHYHIVVELQMEAQNCAIAFNRAKPSDVQEIRFASVHMIMLNGQYFIAEDFIDGKYQKFNSNGGWVAKDPQYDTLQTFSHFTWVHSKKKMVICDLQGVQKGKEFLLTDPALHHKTLICKYGGTNLAGPGIQKFFSTHTCNRICAAMHLEEYSR